MLGCNHMYQNELCHWRYCEHERASCQMAALSSGPLLSMEKEGQDFSYGLRRGDWI